MQSDDASCLNDVFRIAVALPGASLAAEWPIECEYLVTATKIFVRRALWSSGRRRFV